MNTARLAAKSRAHLDARFREIGEIQCFTPPVRGWVKAIRESLGMSTNQLATRLGIKQPSVIALEQSEGKGTVSLATLRRAAEALDCTLVYALIPNKPLDATIRALARTLARQRLEPVEHTMMPEDQTVLPRDPEAKLDELVRDTPPRLFWN